MFIMSLSTLIVYGLGGLTTCIATVAISGIILLVLYYLMLLVYRRFFAC